MAHALDLVGERWALLVIRELRLGPRRYVDLQTALPGLGPSVLAQRLRDLEQAGVLHKRKLPPPAAAQVYELTERGYGLEPVFVALANWGARSPTLPVDGELSDDTVMLGVRTFFDPGDATPWTATYQVRLAVDSYRLTVQRGRLATLVRGEPDGPVDAEIATTREAVHAMLTGRTPDGGVAVDGDEAAARRLLAAVRRTVSTGS